MLFFVIIALLQSSACSACPTDYRRLDETYYLREYTTSIDSFWMNTGHLFVITFKSPAISDGKAKVFYTNNTSRKILNAETSFQKISTGLYRAYVFLENTEIYGKGHVQISGKLLGTEGAIQVLFDRDMKPFLADNPQGCY